MKAADLAAQPLRGVVAALRGTAPTPAAGSAAALTLAVAAGLVGKCARKAAGLVPEAGVLCERARSWEDRALGLADEDAETFAAALAARGNGAPADVLSDAAGVPLAVAALGADVAAAAADLAERGKPALRGDALTAALLAEAATRSAVELVCLNLAEAVEGDARTRDAAGLATMAAGARARAQAAVSRCPG